MVISNGTWSPQFIPMHEISRNSLFEPYHWMGVATWIVGNANMKFCCENKNVAIRHSPLSFWHKLHSDLPVMHEAGDSLPNTANE